MLTDLQPLRCRASVAVRLFRILLIFWMALATATHTSAQTGTQTGSVAFSQAQFQAFVPDVTNIPITVNWTGSTDVNASVLLQATPSNSLAVVFTNSLSQQTTLQFPTNGPSSITVYLDVQSEIAPGTTGTVDLALSDASGATLGTPSNATLLIISTNQAQIEFASSTFNVPATNDVAEITILLTGANTGTATVDFATSDGTAVNGTDYTGTNGTAIFSDGIVSNVFEVGILNHSVAAGTSLTVNLSLTNAVGAGLGTPNTAVLNINGPAVIQFNQTIYPVLERTGAAVVTVVRTGDSSGVATVDYATSDGTNAVNGIDYIGTSGSLTFSPGDTNKTFSFVIERQRTFESNKFVNVSLSNNSELGPTSNAVVVIVNDHPQSILPFTDNNGNTVMMTLEHAGEMNLTPDNNALLLSFTDDSSVINIKVKKGKNGTGFLELGSISGNTACGLINAGSVDLTEDGLELAGHLGSVRIHDVADFSSLAAGGTPDQSTRIFAHVIGADVTISTGSRIVTFDSTEIGDGTSITAPSIGDMAVTGDATNRLDGNFGATMELTGDGISSNQNALGTLHVAGAITNAQIIIDSGNIGAISAYQMLDSVVYTDSGDIGAVSVYQMLDSMVYVGYTPDDPNNPFGGGGFASDLRLGSVNVRASTDGFADSFIVSPRIGTIQLRSVAITNLIDDVDTPFGIGATQSISSVTVQSPKGFKFAPHGVADQSLGDFHVIIPVPSSAP